MDLGSFLGRFLELAVWLVGLQPALIRRSRKGKPGVAEHPLRRLLLAIIRRRPGVRLSALWKQLDANRKTTAYHLMVLERSKAVSAFEVDKQVRFFPSEIPLYEQEIRAVLLRGRVCDLALKIVRDPGIRQKDLGNALKISRKVMRRYVDLLVEHDLLKEVRVDHGRRYYATERLTEFLPKVSKELDREEKAESDGSLPRSARSP